MATSGGRDHHGLLHADEDGGSAGVAPASAKFWGTHAVEAEEEGAWRCELPGGSWSLVLTREDCKVLAYKTLAVVVLSYLLLPLVALKKDVYPVVYIGLLIITHVGVLVLYFYKVKFRKLDGSWRSLTARILALAFCIGEWKKTKGGKGRIARARDCERTRGEHARKLTRR